MMGELGFYFDNRWLIKRKEVFLCKTGVNSKIWEFIPV